MKQFQLFIKKNSETEMKKIADTKIALIYTKPKIN